MQRADKIALIVASVLVVALAAAGGLLLYTRSQTLAAERPLDGAVKLTKLEDTSTLPPEPTSTPASTTKKAEVPSKPKGADDFGFVTLVGTSGGDVYIKWDQAELLTGPAADVYAKKNGAIVNTQPYYLANDTKKNKGYDVSSRAKIIVATPDGGTTTMSAAEFDKDWNASGPSRKRPYWLFLDGGVVVRMEQVVLPDIPAQ